MIVSTPAATADARLFPEPIALTRGLDLKVGPPTPSEFESAFGGYVVQLAKADGLHVIADASAADEDLVRNLGANEVVHRGDDVAERIRALVPEGVDGVADGAVLDQRVAPAIRDGGGLAVVRGWKGEPGRGITVHRVFVVNAAKDTAALNRLRQQAEQGILILRVAKVLPAAEATQAHRLFEAEASAGDWCWISRNKPAKTPCLPGSSAALLSC